MKRARAALVTMTLLVLLEEDETADSLRREITSEGQDNPGIHDLRVLVSEGVVEYDPGEDDTDPTFADFRPLTPNDNAEDSA